MLCRLVMQIAQAALKEKDALLWRLQAEGVNNGDWMFHETTTEHQLKAP